MTRIKLQMLISIIIPAFNEEKRLRQTLMLVQRAVAESHLTSWELIVCDNNSTDKTAVIAKEMGATVTFEPVNQISRARNSGAAVAQGAWLLFIDADSYPSPALMSDTLDVINDGNYVGCGTTIAVEGGTLFNKLRMERMNPFFRLFNWTGGAFLLAQREAFEAISGFSTDLYAYEEVDFVIRLKRYGCQQNKKFTVLYRHPVVTSGRKGEYNILSMVRLFLSNFTAVILFGLYYVLPKSLVRKLGSRLLGYWYNQR